MGGALERLYKRSPLGYVAGVVVLSLVAVLFIVFVALAMYARFTDLQPEAHLRLVLWCSAAVILGFVLATWLSMRRERVFGWVRGAIPPERVQEVWSDVERLEGRILSRYVVVVALVVTPVLLVVGQEVVGADLTEQILLFTGEAFAFLIGAVFLGGAFDVLLRPVRIDLDRQLKHDAPASGRRVKIGPRLVLEVFAVAFFSAIITAGLMFPPGAGAGTLLVLLVGAIATSAPVVLLVGGVLTARVLVPIRELLLGTKEVASGNLGARVPLASTDEHLTLAASFNTMVRGLREREALHSAVGAYIDPTIAERVASEGAAISGEAAEVTVMFVDIVGFTRLAEGAVPEEVVSDLNDFFGLVIPAIVEHGGHANKLLGDGLMAVFGVPTAYDDHADRAFTAARQIQAQLAARYDGQLRAGIGLNSGTVVVGSMGGGPKLDYTIIGDAVNVAARVEAYTRETGDGILLTETTRELLSSSDGLEPRGSQPLKGRSAAVELWAVS